MAGIASKNKAASAQAQAAANEGEQNMALLETRQNQTQDASVSKQQERMMQGRRERAKLEAAFGNSGITGNTPLRQIHTSMVQQAKDTGQIRENTENELTQIEQEQEAVATKTEGRINQAKSRTTTGALAGLQIIGSAASGGMSGYSSGKQMQASEG